MDRMGPAELDLFLGGEDEELQGPISLPDVDVILEVRAHDDGRASVIELAADDNGDLAPAGAQKPRHFATVDAALAHSGRTGRRPDGRLVAVILDDQIVW